ncbi:starch-binding protein [Anaeromicropila herbilytica]|uniref:Alpha-amylase n=1 Tax=Anaeromicropila herbilytica TaxID=2785025 RepID=A0A7R7EHH3_9FIRM|nr:starch-binding protein [Anaeromicropila herbilytica]BCN28784.1 alpha-amylase [Anaeromicropila herbilytica]
MRNKRYLRGILAILLALVLTLQILPQQATSTITSQAATTNSLANVNTRDGLIIQMHMWSFNNIKSKLPEIAAAGFKAIQVSPIQGAKNSSEWWSLYQPINQSIGNPLGSRQEFQDLCSEAEKYNIDVIVDVIMNHVANQGKGQEDVVSDQVSSEFKRTDFYHNKGQCSDWKNRWAVTQQGIGMPDLNTQSSEVQAKAISFLNDCIACGADGFRFDAAKHIETNVGEDANKAWAGNYWTNVLGNLTNKNVFIYGEVLDEANSESDNIQGYASFMSVTDHYYGSTLRNAVKSSNLSVAQNWNVNLPANRRVSYVENHDNYEHNESGINDDQRKIAWGILAARDNVTPMYLSRRTGSMGSVGTTDFENTEIAAVNWFHNAMIGQSEYLRYSNNNSCMLVDRGRIGTAIINEGGSFYLSSATNLTSGTYTDNGGSGATFNVSGGTITGNVPGNRIIVLYQDGINPTPSTSPTVTPIGDVVKVDPATPVVGQPVSITYNATGRSLTNSSNVSLHWGYDNWKNPQNVPMTKISDNTWSVSVTVPESATTSLNLVFTNGSVWDNNSSANWSFTVSKQSSPTPTPTVSPIPSQKVAYFDNSSTNWNNVNVYVYDESGSSVKQVAAWPGVAMTKESNGLYSYTLSEDWNTGTTRVIFNNGGSSQIPAAKQTGYLLEGKMIYQNGNWIIYNGNNPVQSVVAYFDNSTYNWSNVNIYVYDESGTSVKKVAAWPGVAMTKDSSGLYSYILPDGWSTTSTRVIFNNGSTQIPSANQQGYLLQKSMILRNGTWSEY